MNLTQIMENITRFLNTYVPIMDWSQGIGPIAAALLVALFIVGVVIAFIPVVIDLYEMCAYKYLKFKHRKMPTTLQPLVLNAKELAYRAGLLENFDDEVPEIEVTEHIPGMRTVVNISAPPGEQYRNNPNEWGAMMLSILPYETCELTNFKNGREFEFRLTYESQFPDMIEWTPERCLVDSAPDTIAIGENTIGEQKLVSVRGVSTWLAGNSGAGKGSIMWSIIAGLAGRDDTELFGIDLKGGTEFNLGKHVFSHFAMSLNGARAILDYFYEECARRQRHIIELQNSGKILRKLPVSNKDGERTLFLIIDEVLELERMNKLKRPVYDDVTGEPEYDENGKPVMATYMEILASIVQRGRSLSVAVMIAGQSASVQDVSVGRRMRQRIGMQMEREMQDVFLPGSSNVFPLHSLQPEIVPADMGVVIIKDKGNYSVVKTYYPTDETVVSLPATLYPWEPPQTNNASGNGTQQSITQGKRTTRQAQKNTPQVESTVQAPAEPQSFDFDDDDDFALELPEPTPTPAPAPAKQSAPVQQGTPAQGSEPRTKRVIPPREVKQAQQRTGRVSNRRTSTTSTTLKKQATPSTTPVDDTESVLAKADAEQKKMDEILSRLTDND